MTMDSLSNGETVPVQEEWIQDAVQEFEALLRKQINREPEEFRLRASNIGKPLCQLQNEKSDLIPTRMPYNHILRMMIGDAVEIYTTLFVKMSGANVTAQKQQIELDINGTIIKGEDDLEIDQKVYDVKSSSPFVFKWKWSGGWSSLYEADPFGYIGQLWTYATGRKKKPGGWIVADKSSGEIKVVEWGANKAQETEIQASIENNQISISKEVPFRKQFNSEVELFRKKPTGNTVIPMICTFCNYLGSCWPNAVTKPQALSKAVNPKMVVYDHFQEQK